MLPPPPRTATAAALACSPHTAPCTPPPPTRSAYIPIADLAAAIVLAALNTTLPGHEVMYIAAPDSAGGHDLAAWVKAKYGDAIPVRPLPFPSASSLDCSKAVRLLGWKPTLTWRDFLGADGKLLPGKGP